ncbi:hypothetical protein [Methanobrevibacter intestini]|uniref:hypothetical protein n=1 Tax=Methanobrevibacter intestini TaxID=2911853 RepID=UPI003CFD5607
MLINITNDCDKCMECVETCQTETLTEELINTAKNSLNSELYYFRKYIPTCTYCESCESVCEKHAIWIVNPEWEELQ